MIFTRVYIYHGLRGDFQKASKDKSHYNACYVAVNNEAERKNGIKDEVMYVEDKMTPQQAHDMAMQIIGGESSAT